MADQKLHDVVAQVVNDVFDEHMATLRSGLIERACAEVEPLLGAAPATPPGAGPTDLLNAAFLSLLDSSSQAEILGALLAGVARFSVRAALFVIRGGVAIGWRATGFGDDGAIKAETLSTSSGLIARAVRDRLPVAAAATEFDADFVSRFGAPAGGTNVLVLPLLLHEKVPAILYADGGDKGLLDASALECLVRSAGLWLEVVNMRKSHPGEGAGTSSSRIQAAAEAPAPATAAEPVAAEAAEEAPASPPAAPLPEEAAGAPPPPPPPVAAPAVAAAGATAPASETSPVPAVAEAIAPPAAARSAEEEEVHRKAKRFAKLLVEEIKLYNQAKVAQGRAHKNLYALLREDIEKSLASYSARYGQTCAAEADYFTEQIVKVLCEGDASLLGQTISR